MQAQGKDVACAQALESAQPLAEHRVQFCGELCVGQAVQMPGLFWSAAPYDAVQVVALRVGQDSQRPLPGETFERPVLPRSEEHTSELQSLMRISYAVFCLK